MKSLKQWLFPSSCLFCRSVMEKEDEYCCALCLAKIHPLPKHICMHCGVVMPEILAPGPCGKCLTDKPVQSSTTSLYAYQGAVRDAVLAWKLQGQDAALAWLLDIAKSRLQALIHTDDILIPVPMPLMRMRKQGKHHAADLCAMIAQHVGCKWDWRVLRRQGEQERQSALTASARRKNLRKAFKVDADYWHKHYHTVRRVWLIDDIITTGMTVHFASKALRAIDNDIHVLSITRAVKGGE